MKKNVFDHLQNKVCVLTGGGGAIGSSLAVFLARRGIKMAILDLNGESAAKVADKIKQEIGTRALGLETNVLIRESLEEAKKEINTNLGPIDFLVNAAGGNSPKGTTELEFLDSPSKESLANSFYGMDVEGFSKVYDLNFNGTLLPTMIFTQNMLENGGGAVVNFSSMSAFHPLTRVGAYSAAKAAVSNFTEWLAVHLARQNIRVNAVAPGFFVGEQNRFLLFDENTGELTARGKKIIDNTPMGRFGEYDEIHGTVLYLLSDLAKFVTGVVLPVDGGFNAYSGV